MKFKKPTLVILFVVSIVLQSCKGDLSIDNVLDNKPTTSKLAGSKHILNEDGIQILLPKKFKRISIPDYTAIVNDKKNEKMFPIERLQLENSRALDGNNYMFFSKENNATYFVNSIPFSEVKKEDAQKLLGIIRQNQKKASETTDVVFEKITAKYKAVAGAQIFKAVFKADFEKSKKTNYQHTYYISSKDKSVLLSLVTPEEINFDPYIEKMTF